MADHANQIGTEQNKKRYTRCNDKKKIKWNRENK